MIPQAILFDLDGTLADTALDLGGALNDVLRQVGQPEKTLAEIRAYVSHGSAGLIGFGANVTPQMPEFELWQQRFLDRYEQRFAQDTVLFEGVNQVLLFLQQQGIKWGIVTNKHARFTDKLVSKLNFAVLPDVVVSGDTCDEAKPSPQPLFYACEKMGVQPENCWYVGDAQRDIQAGKNAGMHTVLAKWGYIGEHDIIVNWAADEQIDEMNQLLDLLSSLKIFTIQAA